MFSSHRAVTFESNNTETNDNNENKSANDSSSNNNNITNTSSDNNNNNITNSSKSENLRQNSHNSGNTRNTNNSIDSALENKRNSRLSQMNDLIKFNIIPITNNNSNRSVIMNYGNSHNRSKSNNNINFRNIIPITKQKELSMIGSEKWPDDSETRILSDYNIPIAQVYNENDV